MSSVPILLSALLAAVPQGPSSPNDPSVLDIVPVRHLCTANPELPAPPWSSMLTSGDNTALDLLGIDGESEPAFEPEDLVGLVEASFEDEVDSGLLSAGARADAIMLSGSPEVVAAARELITRVGRAVARPIELEIACWRADDEAEVPTVLSEADYRSFAERHELVWRQVTTTRHSRPVLFDGSEWTSYLIDSSVEIAQSASIASPVDAAFFTGTHATVVACTLVESTDLALFVQIARSELAGPVEKMPTNLRDTVDLDRPRLLVGCAAFSGRVRNGGALCATLRGEADRGISFQVTIRARCKTPPPDLGGTPAILPIEALTTEALRVNVAPPRRGIERGEAGEGVEAEAEDEDDGLTDDDVLEFAHSALPEGTGDVTMLRARGGYLFVAGGDDAPRRVRDLVVGLQDKLLRNATVTARTELAGENGAVLHEIVVPTLAGHPVTAARRRETTIIRTFACEVAQKESIRDPIVSALQTGAFLRATVSLDGEHGHLWMLRQCSEGVEPHARSVIPEGRLYLPAIVSRRIDFEGLVDNGKKIQHGNGPTVLRNGEPRNTHTVTTVRW